MRVRPWLGIGAVMLLVSSLLAVVPSSLSAADRGVEGGLTEGRRVLAGPDRYSTAVLLAANAIDSGEAGTTEAVVVSGESLVDALSAASLAAAKSSVVLLTQTAALPDVVREFIKERRFGAITIVGGPAAVSSAVAEQLLGLASVNSVGRVEGADRYATSAEVAAAGVPGRWCGDGQATVVVVSGESLIDGVLAAPVAYAMGLPVLYTRPDGLPAAVDSYLASAFVGQAVVVGSEAEVGAGVVSQLNAASVSVKRIDGADAPRRSVALIEALDDCGDAFKVADDGYALVDVDVPVDGVTAAAALASGLNAPGRKGQLVPLLAVSGDLPSVVRTHLREVEPTNGSDDVTVWALGGPARITPEVMGTALEAVEYEAPQSTTASTASSGRSSSGGSSRSSGGGSSRSSGGGTSRSTSRAGGSPVVRTPTTGGGSAPVGTVASTGPIDIAARITARANTDYFTVLFDAPVSPSTATNVANYRINGQPLLPSARATYNPTTNWAVVDLDGVNLRFNDYIELLEGRVGSPAGQTPRRAQAAYGFVDSYDASTFVIATPGRNYAYVNPGGYWGARTWGGDGLDLSEVTLTLGGRTITSGNGNPHELSLWYSGDDYDSATVYWLSWGCGAADNLGECSGSRVGLPHTLQPGDKVTVAANGIYSGSPAVTTTVRTLASEQELRSISPNPPRRRSPSTLTLSTYNDDGQQVARLVRLRYYPDVAPELYGSTIVFVSSYRLALDAANLTRRQSYPGVAGPVLLVTYGGLGSAEHIAEAFNAYQGPNGRTGGLAADALCTSTYVFRDGVCWDPRLERESTLGYPYIYPNSVGVSSSSHGTARLEADWEYSLDLGFVNPVEQFDITSFESAQAGDSPFSSINPNSCDTGVCYVDPVWQTQTDWYDEETLRVSGAVVHPQHFTPELPPYAIELPEGVVTDVAGNASSAESIGIGSGGYSGWISAFSGAPRVFLEYDFTGSLVDAISPAPESEGPRVVDGGGTIPSSRASLLPDGFDLATPRETRYAPHLDFVSSTTARGHTPPPQSLAMPFDPDVSFSVPPPDAVRAEATLSAVVPSDVSGAQSSTLERGDGAATAMNLDDPTSERASVSGRTVFSPTVSVEVPYVDGPDAGSANDLAGDVVVSYTSDEGACTASASETYTISDDESAPGSGLGVVELTSAAASLTDSPAGRNAPCQYVATFSLIDNGDVLFGASPASVPFSNSEGNDVVTEFVAFFRPVVGIYVPGYEKDDDSGANYFEGAEFVVEFEHSYGPTTGCSADGAALTATFTVGATNTAVGVTPALVDVPSGESTNCVYQVTFPGTVTAPNGTALHLGDHRDALVQAGSTRAARRYSANDQHFSPRVRFTVPFIDSDANGVNDLAGGRVWVSYSTDASTPAYCPYSPWPSERYTVAAGEHAPGSGVGVVEGPETPAVLLDRGAGQEARCRYAVTFGSFSRELGVTLSHQLPRGGVFDAGDPLAASYFDRWDPTVTIDVPQYLRDGTATDTNYFEGVDFDVTFAPTAEAPDGCTAAPANATTLRVRADGRATPLGSRVPGLIDLNLVDVPAGETTRCTYVVTFPHAVPAAGTTLNGQDLGMVEISVPTTTNAARRYLADETSFTPSVMIEVPFVDHDGDGDNDLTGPIEVIYTSDDDASPEGCTPRANEAYVVETGAPGAAKKRGIVTGPEVPASLTDRPAKTDDRCVYTADFQTIGGGTAEPPMHGPSPNFVPFGAGNEQAIATTYVPYFKPTVTIRVPQIEVRVSGVSKNLFSDVLTSAAGVPAIYGPATFEVAFARSGGPSMGCSTHSEMSSYTVQHDGTVTGEAPSLVDRLTPSGERCVYSVTFPTTGVLGGLEKATDASDDDQVSGGDATAAARYANAVFDGGVLSVVVNTPADASGVMRTVDVAVTRAPGAHADCGARASGTGSFVSPATVSVLLDADGSTFLERAFDYVDFPAGSTSANARCRYVVSWSNTDQVAGPGTSLWDRHSGTSTFTGSSRVESTGALEATYAVGPPENVPFDATLTLHLSSRVAQGTTFTAYVRPAANQNQRCSGTEAVMFTAPAPSRSSTQTTLTQTVPSLAGRLTGVAERCEYEVDWPTNEDAGTAYKHDLTFAATTTLNLANQIAANRYIVKGASYIAARTTFSPSPAISLPFFDTNPPDGAHDLAGETVTITYTRATTLPSNIQCSDIRTETYEVIAAASLSGGGDTRIVGAPAMLVDLPAYEIARCEYDISVTVSRPVNDALATQRVQPTTIHSGRSLMLTYEGRRMSHFNIDLSATMPNTNGIDGRTSLYAGSRIDVRIVRTGGPAQKCTPAPGDATVTLTVGDDGTATSTSGDLVHQLAFGDAACGYQAVFPADINSAPGVSPVWAVQRSGRAATEFDISSMDIARTYVTHPCVSGGRGGDSGDDIGLLLILSGIEVSTANGNPCEITVFDADGGAHVGWGCGQATSIEGCRGSSVGLPDTLSPGDIIGLGEGVLAERQPAFALAVGEVASQLTLKEPPLLRRSAEDAFAVGVIARAGGRTPAECPLRSNGSAGLFEIRFTRSSPYRNAAVRFVGPINDADSFANVHLVESHSNITIRYDDDATQIDLMREIIFNDRLSTAGVYVWYENWPDYGCFIEGRLSGIVVQAETERPVRVDNWVELELSFTNALSLLDLGALLDAQPSGSLLALRQRGSLELETRSSYWEISADEDVALGWSSTDERSEEIGDAFTLRFRLPDVTQIEGRTPTVTLPAGAFADYGGSLSPLLRDVPVRTTYGDIDRFLY